MSYSIHIKDDFQNLLDYQHWLKKSFANLSEKNVMHLPYFSKNTFDGYHRGRDGWFGKDVTYEEMQEGIKEYMNPELLDDLYQKVQNEIESVFHSELKARKLKFNALGLGMFCFDRAAMTLYRNREYYSESLQKVIPPNEVKQPGKGYSLKSDGSPVTERWELNKEGKPKVRTHTKEVFAYFPQVKREKPAVEFFISCVAPVGVNAQNLLYAGVSAAIMAEILVKAGVKIKINMMIGTSTLKSKKDLIGCIVPVKHYDEPLDRNLLALMSSDPRFMRYDAFKGLVAVYDHFKKTVSRSFGYPLSAAELKQTLENSDYTEKLQSTYRYYFGGAFSEGAAIRDITQTIKDISDKLKS
jgi:hypothetical protein